MDSLFPEHSADADPRKLNMARLTASTRPIAFGEGDSFVHVGMMSHEGVTGEHYAYTGKRLSPLPNYVMDWTTQQSVKAVTSSVAAQARSRQDDNTAGTVATKPVTTQDFKRAQYLNRVTGYKDPNKQNALELQQLYGFRGKAADGDFGPTSWMANEIFEHDATKATLERIRAAGGDASKLKQLYKAVQAANANYQEASIDSLLVANNQSGLPNNQVKALLEIESGARFNAGARNPSSSATGLGQVTDGALRQYNKVNNTSYTLRDLYDPATNIEVSTGYMAWLKNTYKLSSTEDIFKRYHGHTKASQNQIYWEKIQKSKYFKGGN